MKALRAAAILLLSMFSAVSYAAPDLYVGAGAGVSSADIEVNVGSSIQSSTDESGSAQKVFAGLKFTENLSAELAYVRLGEFGYTLRSGANSVVTKIEGDSIAASAILRAPLQAISLFGRIGLHRFNVDADYSLNGALVDSESASGTKPLLGLGAELPLGKQAFARVELERYMDIGNDSMGKSDIDVLSASIGFNF